MTLKNTRLKFERFRHTWRKYFLIADPANLFVSVLLFLKKDLSWLTTIIHSFKYLSDELLISPAKLWDRSAQ